MATSSSSATATASSATANKKLDGEQDADQRTFYNEEAVFSYYMEVWGGTTIHIGVYDEVEALPLPRNDDALRVIRQGGLLSMQRILGQLPALQAADRVADLGSAYGQLAREICSSAGCPVTCVDLASKMNRVNCERNQAAGLDHLIEVRTGDYTASGLPSAAYSLVVSQDAFLHAGQRRQLLVQELARLLKPGGMLIFTDIMQSDDADPQRIQPLLSRIELESLTSPSYYKDTCAKYGLKFLNFDDLSLNIHKHYRLVKQVAASKQESLKMTTAQLEAMNRGCERWALAAEDGHLKWGIMSFRKEEKA